MDILACSQPISVRHLGCKKQKAESRYVKLQSCVFIASSDRCSALCVQCCFLLCQVHVCVVSVVCRMTVGAYWWSLNTEPTRVTFQVTKKTFMYW